MSFNLALSPTFMANSIPFLSVAETYLGGGIASWALVVDEASKTLAAMQRKNRSRATHFLPSRPVGVAFTGRNGNEKRTQAPNNLFRRGLGRPVRLRYNTDQGTDGNIAGPPLEVRVTFMLECLQRHQWLHSAEPVNFHGNVI